MQNNNEIQDAFDGELLHPSLDMVDGILIFGFRYRTQSKKEAKIIVVVRDNVADFRRDDAFIHNEKTYHIDFKKRLLMHLEERIGVFQLNTLIKDFNDIKPSISFNDFFNDMVICMKKYIELEEENDYILLAAWCIGTYFHPIFSAYPILNLKGPKGSGKSQGLNILSQLCFNAVKARPTLAAFGDTVDALRGTYLIDQGDSLERPNYADLLDILTDSYKKNGGKRRVMNLNKAKEREVLEYDTYSPKAIASIRELPEDLRDRCLIIPVTRSQKNFADPDADIRWKGMRYAMYQLLMSSYSVLKNEYEVGRIAYQTSQKIIGRKLELWLPIETILKHAGCSEEKVNEVRERFVSHYQFADYEPTELDIAVFTTIYETIGDKNEIIISPKEIVELMHNFFADNGIEAKQNAARVGWIIRKFNLAAHKSRNGNGVCYTLTREKINKVYTNYVKMPSEPTPPYTQEEKTTDIQPINNIEENLSAIRDV